jgi:hypothetical protein
MRSDEFGIARRTWPLPVAAATHWQAGIRLRTELEATRALGRGDSRTEAFVALSDDQRQRHEAPGSAGPAGPMQIAAGVCT